MNIKQIQQAMKQAQKMQGDVEKLQAEIDKKEFSKSTGGGVVTITMYGTKLIKEIKINEDVLDKDEKEMLEDLIKVSINQLIEEIEDYTKEQMGPITQGLPF